MSLAVGTSLQDVPLAPLTTWGIGGPASVLFCPKTIPELAACLLNIQPTEPLYWLGLGSNVLIADEGLAGSVILTHKGLSRLERIEETVVYVEAGVPCAKLARFCAQSSFAQAAFFAGIPGTVGGALAMNAGAWGGETWERVLSVTTIDRYGKLRTRTPSDYTIGYRSVALTQADSQEIASEWFVSALFHFPLGLVQETSNEIARLLKQRATTQPIGTRNCGSVFRNPPQQAAGRLIEEVGLKGFQVGDILVSPKHANFILNMGQGKARDVLKVINTIQTAVFEKFQIQLHPEVKMLGF